MLHVATCTYTCFVCVSVESSWLIFLKLFKMSTKNVLLSHSERNKVVKIPQDKELSDIEYLENEFRKCFAYEGNVSIAVSFHRYSPGWDDYVELDRDEIVNDKEKLKVVVTPRLVTPASSSKSCDESYMECHEQVMTTPSSRSPDELTVDSSHCSMQSHLLDEDDVPNVPHQKGRKRVHVLDDSSGSEDGHDQQSSAAGSL